MAVSIRYPTMQQGYDPQAADQSFDRAFTYGRERRDEKQGLAAFDKYITGLSGGQPAQQQPMSIAALAPQGYPGEVERAPLPDIASGRVAQAFSDERSPWPGAAPKQDRITPQDAARASGPPQGALEAYIRHAAKKRGIDPEIAVKVAMSEGGVNDPYRQSDVVKNGVREQSYGPFQLYMNGGLGNEALAAGIDPRKDWQGGIDFALDKAAQGGWGPWMGAEKVGVTSRMGIGGGQQPMQVADASGGTPAPQGGPTGGSGLPDRETMLALFKSPQTRPLAIELAQAAQAAKQGDPEGALKLEKLRLEVEAMRNPTPDLINAGDGRLFNPATQEWITAPGGEPDAAARARSAAEFGLSQDDPAYRSYVLTGKMPREDQAPLTATDKKAILEADEMVQANDSALQMLGSVLTGEEGKTLNDRAGSGAAAGFQSWMARNDPTGIFDDEKGQATTELENVVIGQALANLKATFGAAPTEGERKILVDLQASIDKTPAERKIIIGRAMEAAKRRLDFNKRRAEELRGGTFYKQGGGQPVTQPGGVVDFSDYFGGQ